jgi:hypothetical protein
MSLISKIVLIGLSFVSFSDSFILQSYKLTKPSKLSRSNTPIYLYKKNNSSSNFLKLNDDDGSSSNYKNKLFNWSEYNFKLQQLLNSSSILFDNDNYNYYYENNDNDNDNDNDNYDNNENNKIINVNFDNDDYNDEVESIIITKRR